MKQCLICSTPIIPFLDLGKHPRANAFLVAGENIQEYFYELELCFCPNCLIVQTLERPPKEVMFNENYAYYTSVNQPMVVHFKNAANKITENLMCDDSFIVEIGSNDGVFLQNFLNYKHLGIEPSLNVLDQAIKKNIDCWGTFFSDNVAKEIVDKKGQADVIYAANVFGHTENINEILSGIKTLLKNNGTFVFEIYYLPKLIEQCSFDLIYDEHIFYYTLHSLVNMFTRYDLELYDVDELTVHGGSIRGYVHNSKNNSMKQYRKDQSNIHSMLYAEKSAGYLTDLPLITFSSQVELIKNDFVSLLKKIKSEGKTIAGYGATAKSTTVLNYCCAKEKLIDFIVDSTPTKQGKYTPGTHVPIHSEHYFVKNPPDYTILFAWNYAEQIMNKQKWYSERGGKWILLHPEVKVI